MIRTWHDYKKAFNSLRGFSRLNDYYWPLWFEQYNYYENNWWNYYFKNIFLNKWQYQTTCIKVCLLESCPGDKPFPHPNYIFDSNRAGDKLDGRRDKYLISILRTFGITWEKKTISKSLIELFLNGVLVIDIYPTHGIRISTKIRKTFFAHFFNYYSQEKLNAIYTDIYNHYKNAPNIDSTIHCSNELYNAGLDNYNQVILNVNNPKFKSL
ncbi:MAG: hypothetical protein R2760_02270 [Chitinophagales bacterium]